MANEKSTTSVEQKDSFDFAFRKKTVVATSTHNSGVLNDAIIEEKKIMECLTL